MTNQQVEQVYSILQMQKIEINQLKVKISSLEKVLLKSDDLLQEYERTERVESQNHRPSIETGPLLEEFRQTIFP